MVSLPRLYQITAASLLLSFTSLPVASNSLSQAIQLESKADSAASQSQQKINRLDDRTRKMLEQYRSANRQTNTLQIYNKHLEGLLASQTQEISSLQQQLTQIETTQREIIPLMLNMQKSLAQFVALDLPFLPKERQKRIETLDAMMQRADVTTAEKFRRLIEAYQIENNYGNTIEAYRGSITLQDQKSSVDFLRFGRIALYYQHLDGSETGFWNNQEKRWDTLSADYQSSIRKGLRIARKETAPDLLTLPLPAPTEAK